MDDETLDHLHAWVRRQYRSESVETVYGVLVRFLEGLDEEDRAYYLAQGWRKVDEACASAVGDALVALAAS